MWKGALKIIAFTVVTHFSLCIRFVPLIYIIFALNVLDLQLCSRRLHHLHCLRRFKIMLTYDFDNSSRVNASFY